MIQLSYRNLLPATSAHLQSVQQTINDEPAFATQVAKAKSEWNSKQSINTAKNAFTDIKQKLVEMCSGVQICVYCEHNEATDVEHIYPKRLYPDKAFTWANYLLACNRCNSHFKKDKFKIFNPANSTTPLDVTPVRNVFVAPINDDALFINQRMEDPMYYLELDFIATTFQYIERHSPGPREYEKTRFTKDTLGLNTRADLVEQRRAAFVFYKSELAKYVLVSQCQNLQQLAGCVDGVTDIANATANFAVEKDRIKESIKSRIKKHNHPTVWKEMVRQRANLPTTLPLFNEVPETLNW